MTNTQSFLDTLLQLPTHNLIETVVEVLKEGKDKEMLNKLLSQIDKK